MVKAARRSISVFTTNTHNDTYNYTYIYIQNTTPQIQYCICESAHIFETKKDATDHWMSQVVVNHVTLL